MATVPHAEGASRHTIAEAAERLDVSEAFLVGLLDRGEIPSTGVGASRSVTGADVEGFRTRHAARRAEALDELARNDAALL